MEKCRRYPFNLEDVFPTKWNALVMLRLLLNPMYAMAWVAETHQILASANGWCHCQQSNKRFENRSIGSLIALLIFVNIDNNIYFCSKFVPSTLPLIIVEPVVLEVLEMTMIYLKFSLFNSKEMQHMRHWKLRKRTILWRLSRDSRLMPPSLWQGTRAQMKFKRCEFNGLYFLVIYVPFDN